MSIEKLAFCLLFTCCPPGLLAQNSQTLRQVEIWTDSTSKLTYEDVQICDFEPFDASKVPGSVTLKNCTWNYWLRIRPDSALRAMVEVDTLLFYCGEHHFITLFVQNGHRTIVTQGGVAQCATHWPKGQTCYFALPSKLARDALLYVKIWNRPAQHFAITPKFLNQQSLTNHRIRQFFSQKNKIVLTMACMAVWAFVLLFTLAQYGQHRERMYKYYVIYLLCLIISLLKLQEKAWGTPVLFSHFPLWFVWSEGIFAVLLHISYRLFVSDIVDLKKHLPQVHRLFRYTIIFLIVYAVLDTFLEIFFFRESYSVALFVWFRAIIALITVYCIVRLFAIRTRVGLLIAIGSSLLYIGALANLFILLTTGFDFQGDKTHMIIICATIELLLFSTALGYKSQMAYKERSELEKQLYDTRNRLSRDLHDDLGSSLSSIALNSTLAQGMESPDKMRETLAHICEEAREASVNVKDLVWVMHPDTDSMTDMLTRMRQFAQNTLETQGIEHQFEVGESVENLQLDMEMRRHFYLLFKEAVNNAAKYAEATLIHIHIREENQKIRMEISDNGKGFDTEIIRKGRGLQNMKDRAKAVGGLLTIESKARQGTKITLIR